MSKPIVAVTRRLPAPTEAKMTELFEVRLNPQDLELTAEQIITICEDVQFLVPTVTDRIDAKLIGNLPPSVRGSANFRAGVDHIDVDAATARSVVVTNTPGVLTEDTADLAIALLLTVPRRMGEGARILREGNWKGWTPTFLMGHRVTGKQLGIVGMGRIGQALAKRARGLDMQIHYHNRNRIDEKMERVLEATYWQSLDNMLAHIDFLSINCPKTPETYHLLNADRLKLLKPHAIIVNTARGDIIDEKALIESLKTGAIAGAGLDVYENEPKIDQKLIGLENVVLLPHLGSATYEGRQAMGDKVVTNIMDFTAGRLSADFIIK